MGSEALEALYEMMAWEALERELTEIGPSYNSLKEVGIALDGFKVLTEDSKEQEDERI